MRIGSLFSGAGGLDLAVEQVFGATTAWHCEIDQAASKVLAAHWPGVPNHGDVTTIGKHPKVAWDYIEPVDILCGGWPCQPFSLAGQRKGADDERALWPYVTRAVRMVRPRIVVLENVSAVLGPEFQRVANDLAACGYDIAWRCLRASDVGAPHRRERLFVLATDTSCGSFGQQSVSQPRGERAAISGLHHGATAHPARVGRHEGRPESAQLVGGSDAAVSGAGPVELLPTPAARESGASVEAWDIFVERHKAKGYNGNGHGDSLAVEVQRVARGDLLPTPTSRDGKGANQRGDDTCLTGALLPTPNAADGNGGKQRSQEALDAGTHQANLTDISRLIGETQWGKYEPAIRRWENLTRTAPPPTEPNTKGNPRLAAAFSEWMLGWPAGWVTAVPGISRNDQLRIIGNGVCPQQAVAALRWLLSISEAVA